MSCSSSWRWCCSRSPLASRISGTSPASPTRPSKRRSRSRSSDERLGITGLTFYNGDRFPEYDGDLFFCAFNTGAPRRIRLTRPALDDVEWVELISHDCRLDVTNGPDGTLYFSDLARIFRLSR